MFWIGINWYRLGLIINKFGFNDTGLIGTRMVLIITRYGIIGIDLAFIDTKFGSIVTIPDSICFVLESIGTFLVLFNMG